MQKHPTQKEPVIQLRKTSIKRTYKLNSFVPEVLERDHKLPHSII